MEWTETLCRETGIRFLTTRPSEIEAASFAIIKEELGEEFLKTCPQDQLPVLCRVIHTTADFSYKEGLYFSEDAVSKGRKALASGIPIITDTTMACLLYTSWDSPENGDCFSFKKPVGTREWSCGYGTESLYAGFPHLYFYGHEPVRFLELAARRRDGECGRSHRT